MFVFVSVTLRCVRVCNCIVMACVRIFLVARDFELLSVFQIVVVLVGAVAVVCAYACAVVSAVVSVPVSVFVCAFVFLFACPAVFA